MRSILSPLLLLLVTFAIIVLAAFVVLVMANFASVWSTLTVAGLLGFCIVYLIKWIIKIWVRYEDQRG